jgi:hypothetical protein
LGFDLNSKYIDEAPTETKVFVRRNAYDTNRATILVYNWQQANTVNVDVNGIISTGDSYELRNVQDYFGDVVSGTYSGGMLSISMNGRSRAKPIGYDQVSDWYHDPLQPNTFPTFGAFVLSRKPTAMPTSAINGQVVTPTGLGLRNAQVTLTNADGTTRTTPTGPLGSFLFTGVELGQVVWVQVSSRRFRFDTQSVNVSNNTAEMQFVALQ